MTETQFNFTLSAVLTSVVVIASSFMGMAVLQEMAGERCYGPAFPDHPACEFVTEV